MAMHIDTASQSTDVVRQERDGAVAIITLARADALNAVNDAIRIGLVSACEGAENDPAVRAVVIRPHGERSFCVGAQNK
jgi:2-(1,2-epoxy-1,2-dihydrophenyl)acetyl-CoA isomerase